MVIGPQHLQHLLDAESEIASQHMGVEPDHGRGRLAGMKSTGTGGRWLLSRPNPLGLTGCAGLQGRTLMWSPTSWKQRALGLVTCPLLVIEQVLEIGRAHV